MMLRRAIILGITLSCTLPALAFGEEHAESVNPGIHKHDGSSREVATLLRSIANLIDDEPQSSTGLASALSSRLEKQIPPRTTVIVKLRHAPASDIATAIQEFVKQRAPVPQKMDRQFAVPTTYEELMVVPKLESNSIIVSGSREGVQGIQELIRELDVQSDQVMIEMVIAEKGSNDPVTEDELKRYPEALRSWVTKNGRLNVLSRPQVMTLNNTSGTVQIGHDAREASGTREPSRTEFTLGIRPRFTADEKAIVVELQVAKSMTVDDHDGSWTREERSSGTKIATEDGRAVVVTGLRASEDEPELVIALTPHIQEHR